MKSLLHTKKHIASRIFHPQTKPHAKNEISMRPLDRSRRLRKKSSLSFPIILNLTTSLSFIPLFYKQKDNKKTKQTKIPENVLFFSTSNKQQSKKFLFSFFAQNMRKTGCKKTKTFLLMRPTMSTEILPP